MTFQLIYYSQRDPHWQADIVGFGDRTDTIGYIGCALTSTAMLLSGHGYVVNPGELNERLKRVNGFVGAGIRWAAVSQLYPKVGLKAFIPCLTTPAPLAQIDASLAAGQPAIVMVDGAPDVGLQTHWIVIYTKKNGDYLMLDPWPYQTDVSLENPMLKRYGQGRPLDQAIKHVILYENAGAFIPGQPGTGKARVKADVIWGLNIRTSSNTSSRDNVLEVVPAGTELVLLEAEGEAKVGAINQWVRVRTPSGKEGVAAAWYLERVPSSQPIPETPPTPQPQPQPQPDEPPSVPHGDQGERLKVVVSASLGAQRLNIYAYESTRAKVVSTQAAGSLLACVEPYDAARAKVGVKGQWLKLRYDVARFGFAQAEFLEAVT